MLPAMDQKEAKKRYQRELKLKSMLDDMAQKILKFRLLFNELIQTKKEGNPDDLLKNI